MTILLNGTDVRRLLDLDRCLAALRDGFLAPASGVSPLRMRTDLPGPGTATALLPGLVDGVPAYTVKVNAKFPGASPALRGVVCLHDLATGELLALLDSATVTAYRTGLAAALGTHALARPGASTVAVIGAGAQSELVLHGLRRLRPVTELLVADLDRERAEAFARRHGGSAVTEIGAADIVVVATWAWEPVLHEVAPGTHVTSLGADEPGKAELAPALLGRARTFVDDLDLAVEMGALGNAGLTREHAAGTIGAVLAGSAGRRDGSEVTVYAPVGLPWQDLALSWAAYETAHQATDRQPPTGLRFDFLG
ncbi:ornithine cyclodeaminase family protein [Actinomadura sp. DC4]|uniref:ornithine cyclodeaminase family protein n=1 Tax=Actinomadura sp. DC4 TaxID=3055069 RepID=UPI0025B1F675|nr:ornithine cyclodeaminase family protein [Actinomadura sp. DC4]MDN3355301.1 ornithine cyclodeaminase family protein [Actinomadura sp. DC4]